METISIIPLTLASVMASFTADEVNVEQAVISTHISPEIAGLWELDLDAVPDFTKLETQQADSEGANAKDDQDLQHLLSAIREANRVEQALVNEANTLAKKEAKNHQAQDKNAQANNSNDLNRYDPNQSIIPMQAATAPKGGQCKERYSFGADNVLITTSGEEWTYGRYMYQHQDQGLPIIAITTDYDNNKMDCSGMQVDQTGEALLAFVDYKPKENLMRWCIDPEGDHCFMTFHRLLP